MSEVLVEVTRGPLVECLHRGDIAIVGLDGALRFKVGDPGKVTYFRSAAKPIQALEVILSGAAGRYGFTDAELALMCASHYGEDFHRSTVTSILAKIGLGPADLHCGSPRSIKTEYAVEAAYRGLPLHPLFSDCSGKHAGMLAVCRHQGYDIKTYYRPDHPLQVRLLQLVSQVCGLEESAVPVGVDGCSVSVFGMPLRNMALGYARLASPQGLSDDMRTAMETVVRAMNAYPEMVAGTAGPNPGTWGFCTQLLKHSHGKLVAKLGAEGVYCVGIRGRGLGIALKIEDGNSRAIHPAVLQVLNEMNILDAGELAALDEFWHKPNWNDHNQKIGEMRAVVKLESINQN